jgi:hypothetical protein
VRVCFQRNNVVFLFFAYADKRAKINGLLMTYKDIFINNISDMYNGNIQHMINLNYVLMLKIDNNKCLDFMTYLLVISRRIYDSKNK